MSRTHVGSESSAAIDPEDAHGKKMQLMVGQRLAEYARKGHADEMARLLKLKPDVNWRGIEGFTPLQAACQVGMDRWLFHHPTPSPPRPKAHSLRTVPLARCSKLLIEAGADLTLTTNEGYSALHLAADHGFHLCLEQLIDAGADVNMVDGDRNTPLHLACDTGRPACTARLIQSGVALNHANNMGANALHAACLNGHFECAPPPAPEPNHGPKLSPNSTRAPTLALAMTLTLTLPLTRCASLLIEAGALVNEVAQS